MAAGSPEGNDRIDFPVGVEPQSHCRNQNNQNFVRNSSFQNHPCSQNGKMQIQIIKFISHSYEELRPQKGLLGVGDVFQFCVTALSVSLFSGS